MLKARGALLAAMLAMAPAAAQEASPRWFTNETGAHWGIPGMDAVGLSVRCEAGRVTLSPALFMTDPPDRTPDVTFAVDARPYVREARLVPSEVDQALRAEATMARDDELITALRRGSELAYDFSPPQREGDRFALSLSGSARAIDEALARC